MRVLQLTAGSGPTPLNLQLLSSCLQQCSQLLECPVCLESVQPPVWQCCHGHLLCSGCRTRSDRCPLCRVPLGPRGRSLLADKLHRLLSQTYRRYSDQRQGVRGPDHYAADAAPEQNDAPGEQAGEPSSGPASEVAPNESTAAGGPTATPEVSEPRPRAHVLTRGLRLTASSEDVTDGTAAGSTAAPTSPTTAATAPRARSQSAGDIVGLVEDKPAEPAQPAESAEPAADLVHCPYGSACQATCRAAEVFNHLREVSAGGWRCSSLFPARHES